MNGQPSRSRKSFARRAASAVEAPAVILLLISAALGACHSSSKPAAGDAQACLQPVVAGTDTRPLTIPALRAWQAAPGQFTLTDSSRIVADPVLAEVAKTFADDLHVATGRKHAVVSGASRAGDIVLAVADCDSRLGAEGYELAIGKVALVQAPQEAGVFYGTRSILQLLKQGASIPAGRAADWPRYPERGLMVDVGRQYFTPDWLAQHIRQLAYLKLNYFHWHLSDSEGFRIENPKHPEIVSADHLKLSEVRELIKLARRYHVEIVPEIDMPGHLAAALAPHPEFKLKNVLGQPADSQLDITNDAARNFARELIEEYIDLFPGRYWHIGGDEYMPPAEYVLYPQLTTYASGKFGVGANTKDAIHDFDNFTAGIVQAHGKTARMWNDDLMGGSKVTVDPNIVVEWWTNVSPLSDIVTVTPQQLVDQGHRVMNAGWYPNYYTIGFTGLLLRPSMKDAYEKWSVEKFQGIQNVVTVGGNALLPPDLLAPDEPANLGSKLNVWIDSPGTETENEIAAGFRPNLKVLAQKYWESPLLVPGYADFLPITDAVGNAPGYDIP